LIGEIDIKRLSSWFKSRRWCEFKNQAKIDTDLQWLKNIGKGIYLTVVKVSSTKNQQLYYIPLLSKSREKHVISLDSCIEFGTDNFLCEAEYYPVYYNYIFVNSEILNEGEIRVDIFKNIKPASMVKPVKGSTNPVVKIICDHCEAYILKTYRKVYKRNREHIFLKKLQSRVTFIPSVFAELTHTRYGVFTVILNFFEAKGDGGLPFYNNLISYLEGTDDIAVSLAEKLGVITACLHKALVDYTDPLFKPETITRKDVLTWKNRILRNIEKSEVNVNQKILKNIIGNLDKYLGLLKTQTHQDYHLSQLLYTKNNDFIVLDFEGEPGRYCDALFLKEPALRDLGCMIRSFDYLSYFALSNYLGLDLKKTFSHYRKNLQIFEWRQFMIQAFMRGYFKGIANAVEKIFGDIADIERALSLVLPWILEKALYEVLYEKRYRPYYAIVPKYGVYELLYMKHPIFGVTL